MLTSETRFLMRVPKDRDSRFFGGFFAVLSNEFSPFNNSRSCCIDTRSRILCHSHVCTLSSAPTGQEKSKEECEKIADTIGAVEELPVSCRNYGDIVQKLRSGTAKDRADNPFEGLSAGQAVEATRARKQGGGKFYLSVCLREDLNDTQPPANLV